MKLTTTLTLLGLLTGTGCNGTKVTELPPQNSYIKALSGKKLKCDFYRMEGTEGVLNQTADYLNIHFQDPDSGRYHPYVITLNGSEDSRFHIKETVDDRIYAEATTELHKYAIEFSTETKSGHLYAVDENSELELITDFGNCSSI
jgi:hypothetical protein